MLRTYRELIVWQRSMRLVEEIYLLAEMLPGSERYGLASQVRRAAVSIPANIAEGYVRKYRREYLQFLRISLGSGAELETHLTIIKEVVTIDKGIVHIAERALNEVMRMLNKLIASLESGSRFP